MSEPVVYRTLERKVRLADGTEQVRPAAETEGVLEDPARLLKRVRRKVGRATTPGRELERAAAVEERVFELRGKVARGGEAWLYEELAVQPAEGG